MDKLVPEMLKVNRRLRTWGAFGLVGLIGFAAGLLVDSTLRGTRCGKKSESTTPVLAPEIPRRLVTPVPPVPPVPPLPPEAPPQHISPARLPPPPDPPPPSDDISLAKDAFQRGEYQLALQHAERALADTPDAQGPLSIAGLASCYLKDRERAARYIDRLQGPRRTMVTQACTRNGVSL